MESAVLTSLRPNAAGYLHRLTSIVASQDHRKNTDRGSAPTRGSKSSEELDDIFARQELRKLSKTLTFRYDTK